MVTIFVWGMYYLASKLCWFFVTHLWDFDHVIDHVPFTYMQQPSISDKLHFSIFKCFLTCI